MTPPILGFHHQYLPAAGPGRTLLLLHGTGGDEHSLLPLGRQLDPGAGLLSPRGQVLENGQPRFFRRFAPGVLDLADLEARALDLGAFVRAATAAYGLDPAEFVAVGYSNGANVASALLLLDPTLVRRVALLHPSPALVPGELPDLRGHDVLVVAGRHDPLVSPRQTQEVADLFGQAGAAVRLAWQDGGHVLTPLAVTLTRDWLAATDASSTPGEDSPPTRPTGP